MIAEARERLRAIPVLGPLLRGLYGWWSLPGRVRSIAQGLSERAPSEPRPLPGPRFASTRFRYRGRPLPYNTIPFNHGSERAVEVPIAFDFLASLPDKSRILEVGNVLVHYENFLSDVVGVRPRTIVDKFEGGAEVWKMDLFALPLEPRWTGIVSVSTIEHVGQGREPYGRYGEVDSSRNREAPLAAIARIQRLLEPRGRALVTVPFGVLTDAGWFIQFSTDYIALLTTKYGVGKDALDVVVLARREGDVLGTEQWIEVEPEEAANVRYGYPHPGANAIAVLRLEGSDGAPEGNESSSCDPSDLEYMRIDP